MTFPSQLLETQLLLWTFYNYICLGNSLFPHVFKLIFYLIMANISPFFLNLPQVAKQYFY